MFSLEKVLTHILNRIQKDPSIKTGTGMFNPRADITINSSWLIAGWLPTPKHHATKSRVWSGGGTIVTILYYTCQFRLQL